MLLTALIEAIPENDSGSTRLNTDEISAEADTYEDARDAIRSRVPDGWRMLNIRRD